MTPKLDAWAAVMGVKGSPGMMAPARLGVSGKVAAGAGPGAAPWPAPRSLDGALLTVEGPEGLEALELLELLEGLGAMAHPVSHAVTATTMRGVIFM